MYYNKIATKIIAHLQRNINKEYEEKGLTPHIYDMQLKLNEFKAKYNIVLDDEIITDDGFLQ